MGYFTKEQKAAIKKVETAMIAAGKLGVHFWDNYGMLASYSKHNISHPSVEKWNRNPEGEMVELSNDMWHHSVKVKNFHAGNADDKLYVIVRKINKDATERTDNQI